MSKYLTAGRERFAFIITPAELEAALKDMHLLIISKHVPSGYKETPLGDYVADYSVIYSKLKSGGQPTSSDIQNFTEIGIAKSLEKHTYGNEHTYHGAKYQLCDFDEPCAMLAHFPMHIDRSSEGKSTLTIRASSIQFPEQTIGLELSFPKKIQFACGNDYTPLQSTEDLVSYQSYLMLRDRIKAITRPLRLMMAGREIKPRIRISPEALRDIDGFWFLQQNDIHTIM